MELRITVISKRLPTCVPGLFFVKKPTGENRPSHLGPSGSFLWEIVSEQILQAQQHFPHSLSTLPGNHAALSVILQDSTLTTSSDGGFKSGWSQPRAPQRPTSSEGGARTQSPGSHPAALPVLRVPGVVVVGRTVELGAQAVAAGAAQAPTCDPVQRPQRSWRAAAGVMLCWLRGFVLPSAACQSVYTQLAYEILFEDLDRNGDGVVDIVELRDGLRNWNSTFDSDSEKVNQGGRACGPAHAGKTL